MNPTTAAPLASETFTDVVTQVRTRWATDEGFTPATLEKCGEMIARFARRATFQGARTPADVTAQHAHGFVFAHTTSGQRPEVTTMHARRSAVRMLFRSLREMGYDVTDPTLDLVLPARTATSARPLSETEVALCRASSRMGEAGGKSLHRAVCWALGETTAVTSEISAVRVGDVDDARSPRWVQLPGTKRHDARTGELSEWGSVIVARQLELLTQRRVTPATPLVYKGQGVPGEPAAQSAICNAIGAILAMAGLSDEPDVRPASLRNWSGRRLYDGGMPIEQVAKRMGARSLDTVATDIALQWRGVS